MTADGILHASSVYYTLKIITGKVAIAQLCRVEGKIVIE